MKTKDDFLFRKGKYRWNEKCHNQGYSIQYSNLNLNRTPSLTPVQFCSKLTKDKTWNEKKKLQTWNKNLLTIKKKSEKDQKNWKEDATLISTNIGTPKTYENLFESDKKKIGKFGSIKKNGNEKKNFAASTFVIQNSFEFPIQQNDKISEPEISQFKASQTLLNPNDNIYLDESSIPSYTISQSLLDAFIPPGRTPVPSDEEDEEEKISETASIRENINQSTSKSAEIEAPNYAEDKSREISKDSSNHDMEIDQSLMPEAKADSPVPSSSNAAAPTEQRNTIFQSQPSRLALLLPRFFQATTSVPSRIPLTSRKTKESYATNKYILSLLPSDFEKAKRAIPKCQQRETPQQPQKKLLTSRKTKGLYGKVLDQSSTPEAKADSPILTSSNAEAPAEQRNTIFHPQPSRFALLFPRFLQPTTSVPPSQTTNRNISALLPSDLKKRIPKKLEQRETLQQPPEKIPLTKGKVLDQSFNDAKLPEIDATQFKEFLWPDDTAHSQERRNSGKKRAHPLTPQRQQTEFTDNSNSESSVASRAPPKRVPPNTPPSEHVLDDTAFVI
uniref:Uncharacterized protein n=1 Tax=Panagrolaimus davidi TaxID=227884 RepID=A0A914PRL3_9BILA